MKYTIQNAILLFTYNSEGAEPSIPLALHTSVPYTIASSWMVSSI
jgi:hypothetical protein